MSVGFHEIKQRVSNAAGLRIIGSRLKSVPPALKSRWLCAEKQKSIEPVKGRASVSGDSTAEFSKMDEHKLTVQELMERSADEVSSFC